MYVPVLQVEIKRLTSCALVIKFGLFLEFDSPLVGNIFAKCEEGLK